MSRSVAGDWTLTDSSNFQNIGGSGQPLGSSLHTTTADGSFTFSFSGSFISVLGTAATSGDQPNVQCFLDGVSFATVTLGGPQNNIHICATTFPDGQHELAVNVSTQGEPFYLDNLQYQPSANVPLNNATILIPSGDPSITLSIGWSMVDGFPQNMTQTTNAFANITFIGDQLGWFGTFLEGEPQTPSPAEYSIDGGQPISFTLQLPPERSNSTNTFNIPFFTTDVLQQGLHTVIVRYLGNESTIPLTLNNLLVVNASSSENPSTPSSSMITTSLMATPTSQSRITRGNSTGAIVGGAVGGVVGLFLVILIFFLMRRYSIRKKQRVDPITAVMPFEVNQFPPTRQLPLSSSSFHTPKSNLASGGVTNDTGRTPGEGTLDQPGGPPTVTSLPTSPSHTRTISSLSEGRIPSRTTASIPTSGQTNSSDQGPLPQSPIHVRHEDSGLRVPHQDGIIELPPNYTIN
ncbi:hypothetical protein Clacol_010024 [Clathrus columnatus]|uniref:Transmembrane protein n=1 Tax=Clathrus columnatus TaxID=1419009 RepID=A0AAV5ASK6_9AGAM|nr:hypothetical protein Clacol_010024 [Clathrus columnatus]